VQSNVPKYENRTNKGNDIAEKLMSWP